MSGNAETINLLLDKGATRGERGLPPLFAAVKARNTDTFEALLARGQDPHEILHNDQNLWHAFAESHNRWDPALTDHDKANMVKIAARLKAEHIDILGQSGSTLSPEGTASHHGNEYGIRIINSVIDPSSTLEDLIKTESNPHGINTPQEVLNGKFLKAANEGRASDIVGHLAEGADIDAKNIYEYTAVQEAVLGHHVETYKALAEAPGIDLHAKAPITEGSLFHIAAAIPPKNPEDIQNVQTIVKDLHARGVDPTGRDEEGKLPSDIAEGHEVTKTLNTIEQRGKISPGELYVEPIDIEEIQRQFQRAVSKGETEEALAVLKANPAIAEELLEGRNYSGETPIQTAISKHDLPTYEALLGAGAKLGVPLQDYKKKCSCGQRVPSRGAPS